MSDLRTESQPLLVYPNKILESYLRSSGIRYTTVYRKKNRTIKICVNYPKDLNENCKFLIVSRYVMLLIMSNYKFKVLQKDVIEVNDKIVTTSVKNIKLVNKLINDI